MIAIGSHNDQISYDEYIKIWEKLELIGVSGMVLWGVIWLAWWPTWAAIWAWWIQVATVGGLMYMAWGGTWGSGWWGGYKKNIQIKQQENEPINYDIKR